MRFSHDIAAKIESFLQQYDSNSLETHQDVFPILQAFLLLEEGSQLLLISSNTESFMEMITRPISQILRFELDDELAGILLNFLSDSDIVWTETVSRQIVSIWFVWEVVCQIWVWWQRSSFLELFLFNKNICFPFCSCQKEWHVIISLR
jgi:hypothetical protein